MKQTHRMKEEEGEGDIWWLNVINGTFKICLSFLLKLYVRMKTFFRDHQVEYSS